MHYHTIHHHNLNYTALTHNTPTYHTVYSHNIEYTAITHSTPTYHKVHHPNIQYTALTYSTSPYHTLHHHNIHTICILCKTINNACTEDEYHFLMACPLYADCRAHLEIKATEINYEYPTYNSWRKFTYLLLNCQKYVANFIDKAWEIRITSLYVNTT